MTTDISQYKDEFISEAREHLQSLNESMLELETDPSNSESLNNIFRSAHTLKGSSAMMGFEDLSKLAHSMENVLDGLRQGGRASPALLDTLFRCIDTLETIINNIEQSGEAKFDIAPLLEEIDQRHESSLAAPKNRAGRKRNKPKNTAPRSSTQVNPSLPEPDESAQIVKRIKSGEQCFLVKVYLSKGCEMKSVRAYMIHQALSQATTIFRTNPDPETASDREFDKGLTLILTTHQDTNGIRKIIESISDVQKAEVNSFSPPSIQQDPQGEEGSSITPSLQTIRVSFERLDTLMNLVGELVINKVQLERIASHYDLGPLNRALSNVSRLTTDLQELVMQMRTVPVRHIFQRFPRLIRDLSIKKERKINLEINGMDIEIDRSVLDEINEPLVHLLRNSVDHGIESPEERKKKGKDPVGTIRLTASRKRDHIVIELDDDGAGIDPEKLKQTAVEKGFVPQSEADQMDRDQAIRLIFLPGLSTAPKITDISGRGVGMDVVKTTIESFGGSIGIESNLDTGTKVSIRLPLTLSVTQALLVQVSDQTYAIPVSSIQEVLPLRKEQIRSIGDRDAILLRGDVCVLLWLHDLLGLPHPTGNNLLSAVVVEGVSGKVGVIVDSLFGQQEIVIKSLSDSLKIPGLGGVTILGDGQVVLILDVVSLFQATPRQLESLPPSSRSVEVGLA